MINELLFLVTILVNFICIVAVHRFFGKLGMFAWIGFAIVLANIEVAKNVDMFGLSVTLGNVVYGTIFLVTDILSEMYGKDTAKRAVSLGFIIMILFTIMTQLDLLFVPNESDFVSPALRTIFELTPRLCIASIVAFFISNRIDVFLYHRIKSSRLCENGKNMWLRNNTATIISQLIDSVLFNVLAFYGIFSNEIVIELVVTTYLIKIIIAVFDTPFLYLAKKYRPIKEVTE